MVAAMAVTVLLQDGSTALMEAALQGHEAVVRVLVDAGADKDLQNEVDWARIGC